MSRTLYEAVIGLEIHAQLLTRTKVFCPVAVDTGALPNLQVGVVSAGLPGALPVLNAEAVRLAVLAALALECEVPACAVFERKNYFYPDLPKGYQISQLSSPVGKNGYVDILGETSQQLRVRIDRIQIEEDAGKLSHVGAQTWIDLNRAGTGLIEIVSHPDLRTPQQAAAYMKAVYNALVFAKVCDGNLEKGNFRCDANVSVRRVGDDRLGTRTEIKNVNSFRFVEKAIDYEIARQISVVESGGRIVQETRGWDSGSSTTYTMRSKEDAQDYRYFPDPDLPPLVLAPGWVEELRSTMPPLPAQIMARLESEHALEGSLARTLGADPSLYRYFCELCDQSAVPSRLIATWICGDLKRELADRQMEVSDLPFALAKLAQLLKFVSQESISGQNAKKLLRELFENSEVDLAELIETRKWRQESDPMVIAQWLDAVWAAHPEIVANALAGKHKVLDFLSGQVMKLSAGRANPVVVATLLREKLGQSLP